MAIEIDLGDLTFFAGFKVKGLQRPRLLIRVGHPRDTTSVDRVMDFGTTRPCVSDRKVLFAMDLQADKQVTLTTSYADEMGNPTEGPPGATITYSVDRPDLVALTDHGDGTANAAAVGPLGMANVHVDADDGAGGITSGDFQIVVVAGDAERLVVTAGEPTEVTPDEPAPPIV